MALPSLIENVRPVLAAVRVSAVPPHLTDKQQLERPPVPFVTISRQPGAGAWTLAKDLVEELNQNTRIVISSESKDDQDHHRWTCWDRELVEKAAADHQLNKELVAALGVADHSWLNDFIAGLTFTDEPELADEARVYSGVAKTIRTLAKAGRVVIVGRGGVFITHNMPSGIHVRLIAPLDVRIKRFAQHEGLDPKESRRRLREIERRRRSFMRRYWSAKSLDAQTFTITINCAQASGAEAVKMIKSLIESRLPATVRV